MVKKVSCERKTVATLERSADPCTSFHTVSKIYAETNSMLLNKDSQGKNGGIKNKKKSIGTPVIK